MKYRIIESFFDEIDTEEKAYILGLLWADGCNFPEKYYSVSIRLVESDIDLLENISRLIYPDGKPLGFIKEHTFKKGDKEYSCRSQYSLSITNKHVSKKLESYGMVRNKSDKICIPDFLDKNLIRHFIRGYFDGDGCITTCQRRNHIEFYASILSNIRFCSQVKEIINEIGITGKIIKHVNVYRLQIQGNINIMNFLNWIYEDANIYLKRKYEKYQYFLAWQKQKKKKELINTAISSIVKRGKSFHCTSLKMGNGNIKTTTTQKKKQKRLLKNLVKDWSKFDYITVTPPKWAYVTFLIVLTIVMVFLYLVMMNNDLDKSLHIYGYYGYSSENIWDKMRKVWPK